MSIMSGYFQKQKNLLVPYLNTDKTLLDFGCGDLSLAKILHKEFPKLTITGVDVVDSGVHADGVTFILYDGKTLPFRRNTFDVSVAYHVFHHTSDPRALFGELTRVTEKKMLVVEPVHRNRVDLFFMKITDRIGNGWRNVAIPMPFTFQTEATWRRYAREFHWTVVDTKTVSVLPRWLPIGEAKLFVLTHQHESKERLFARER
jgi:ubiquinone/menaquinone biosynthesis C-methylase UbiE